MQIKSIKVVIFQACFELFRGKSPIPVMKHKIIFLRPTEAHVYKNKTATL